MFIIALVILNASNLFEIDTFLGEENLADARRISFKNEVTANENFAQEVLQLVNVERTNAGLKPLQLSSDLNYFADVRAKELPTLFSHTRPDGTSCFTAVKVSYKYIGENIAAGQPTPAEVVEGWMNSPGHRANILSSKYTQMGIGYVYAPSTDYKHFWAQLFKG